jgi:hypothetical protein
MHMQLFCVCEAAVGLRAHVVLVVVLLLLLQQLSPFQTRCVRACVRRPFVLLYTDLYSHMCMCTTRVVLPGMISRLRV